MIGLTDAELRLMGHDPQTCDCDLCWPPCRLEPEQPRCGYRLAAEPEPCSMPIKLASGTWRHVYRAVDRYHAAVAGQ